MSKVCCPKCDADVTDTYEPDDWSVGIIGGWYCDVCDLGIGEGEIGLDAPEDSVPIESYTNPDRQIGTPISQISGRPGHPGYEEFSRIAKTWGYE